MGFMGPFSGRLGTAVGYMWNGKCCMRAYQRFVHNPRTEAQQAQRNIFKQEVQLASHLRWVLGKTLTEQARGEGLTAYNLFVRDNQHAFALSEGRLVVDYATLRLSMGDVPCVVPTTAVCDDDNVLTVKFERGTGAALDGVYLYVYVPDMENGFLSMPVFRREKSIRLLLPDQYRGHEMHAWLMVERCDGSWSESRYCGTVGSESVSELDTQVVGDEGAVSGVGGDAVHLFAGLHADAHLGDEAMTVLQAEAGHQ